MVIWLFVILVFIIRYVFPKKCGEQSCYRLTVMPVYGFRGKVLRMAYMVTNTFLLFAPLFICRFDVNAIAVNGVVLASLALVFYFFSVRDFCRGRGLISSGVYRLSRNPQTLSFIAFYAGIALCIQSVFYAVVLLFFIFSIHGLLLMEEKYCLMNFGSDYSSYYQSTPRYI